MNFLVRAMGGAARSSLISSCATHVRDSANVPRVPKQQWLETNTLYFDDAEGPDRIGNYNVSSFFRYTRFASMEVFRANTIEIGISYSHNVCSKPVISAE